LGNTLKRMQMIAVNRGQTRLRAISKMWPMLKRAKRTGPARYLFARAHASRPPACPCPIRRATARAVRADEPSPCHPRCYPTAGILSGQGAGLYRRLGIAVVEIPDPRWRPGLERGTFMEILEKSGRDNGQTRCCPEAGSRHFSADIALPHGRAQYQLETQ